MDFRNNQIFKYLAFSILGVITIALIAATIVEKSYSTPFALSNFYHSYWFIALWILLGIASLICIIQKWRTISFPTISIHFALLLILVGAAVTFLFGEKGYILLEKESKLTDTAQYENDTPWKLPFEIRLLDNETVYHNGSPMARDYASEIEIRDVNNVVKSRISMNRVFDYKGYRFFQSGIGNEHSRLTISHDSIGTGVSYAGYFLLLISMICFLFSRNSRFHYLIKGLTTVVMITSITISANASDTNKKQAEVLQPALANNFGKILIQTDTRIAPLQTFAREFIQSIYGSSTFDGYTSEQVLTGWLFYYDAWKTKPFIKVKNKEIRKILGITGKYASIKDFYDRNGYKLDNALQAGVNHKDLMEINDKVDLIAQVCTGAAWKIFPANTDESKQWISWVENHPQNINPEKAHFIDTVMEEMASNISKGKFIATNDLVSDIIDYQTNNASSGEIPSDFTISLERFYNSLPSLFVIAIIIFMIGLIMLVMEEYNKETFNKYGGKLFTRIFVDVNLLYITVLLAIRWIIGHHFPMSSGYETMVGMAWIILFIAMWVKNRWMIFQIMSVIVAGLALLVATFSMNDPAITPLMPVLNSPLLSIHVLTIMTSYALFAIMMFLCIVAFFNPKETSTQTVNLATVISYPATFLLAAGIFIGAIWANNSWGRYWGWDPKETWALITLFIYCLPLHGGLFKSLRKPQILRIYYILAFLSVLFTYFGVNFLLSGLHSYA